jgi:DHA1 family bicyclomycin/chloramphenicol resistance-like MFS transporter
MINSHRLNAIPPRWLLVLVTISGTMAMHMFVPALPEAARSLASSTRAMEMAVSIYVMGMAAGQLIYGPLSDAFGRRPMVLAGLGLYVAGGLAASMAPNLHVLLAARLVQALGGGAGLSLGRAMVRDTTRADAAVRELALLNLMLLLSPGLAPVLGGVISSAAGWRSIFMVLAAIGIVSLGVAWHALPETGKPSGRFGVRRLVADYRELLFSPRFLGFALGGGCATTSVYAFLTVAPFVFVNELHQPVGMAGIYSGLMMVGMATGNTLTSRLVKRVRSEILLRIGNTLSLVSAVVLLEIALLHHMNVANILGFMMMFTCGAGMASPAALGKAVSVRPQLIGSAAGLYGFSQMAVGAICTTIAASGSNPAASALIVMVAATAIAQIAIIVALRCDRAPRQATAETN